MDFSAAPGVKPEHSSAPAVSAEMTSLSKDAQLEQKEDENERMQNALEILQSADNATKAPVMTMQKTVNPRAQRHSAPPPKKHDLAAPTKDFSGPSASLGAAAGGSGVVGVEKGVLASWQGMWTLFGLCVLFVMGLTVAGFLLVSNRRFVQLIV